MEASRNGEQLLRQRQIPVLLTLVRHGETDENKRMVLQGSLETNLNESGRQQARNVGRRLRREIEAGVVPPFSLIFASDNPRAMQTTTLIKEELGSSIPSETKVLVSALLRERRLGCFEGQSIPAVKQEFGSLWSSLPEPRMLHLWDHLHDDYYSASSPEKAKGDVESKKEFWERTENVLKRIFSSIARTQQEVEGSGRDVPSPVSVLVVSHGMTIRGLLTHLMRSFPTPFVETRDIASRTWFPCECRNTSIARLRLELSPSSSSHPNKEENRSTDRKEKKAAEEDEAEAHIKELLS
ncbi:hypothetical protein QOT17_012301 [Balamuthia mandrillaris]